LPLLPVCCASFERAGTMQDQIYKKQSGGSDKVPFPYLVSFRSCGRRHAVGLVGVVACSGMRLVGCFVLHINFMCFSLLRTHATHANLRGRCKELPLQ
jgi:hypothetical protein